MYRARLNGGNDIYEIAFTAPLVPRAADGRRRVRQRPTARRAAHAPRSSPTAGDRAASAGSACADARADAAAAAAERRRVGAIARRFESRFAASAGLLRYDSSEVNDAGRAILQANAAVLKKYPSWVITIEGHCDERGTAEYNLALGERRAVAARTYLISLGIDANRLRTVSYGSEFPFDPAHQESAWSRNRRAHFVITAK